MYLLTLLGAVFLVFVQFVSSAHDYTYYVTGKVTCNGKDTVNDKGPDGKAHISLWYSDGALISSKMSDYGGHHRVDRPLGNDVQGLGIENHFVLNGKEDSIGGVGLYPYAKVSYANCGNSDHKVEQINGKDVKYWWFRDIYDYCKESTQDSTHYLCTDLVLELSDTSVSQSKKKKAAKKVKKGKKEKDE